MTHTMKKGMTNVCQKIVSFLGFHFVWGHMGLLKDVINYVVISVFREKVRKNRVFSSILHVALLLTYFWLGAKKKIKGRTSRLIDCAMMAYISYACNNVQTLILFLLHCKCTFSVQRWHEGRHELILGLTKGKQMASHNPAILSGSGAKNSSKILLTDFLFNPCLFSSTGIYLER